MARYRHVIRKGPGGYYVTQGPKRARVIKAGPFRTRNAAWDWLNDHPEAYSVQQRRRRRARRNPSGMSIASAIGGGVLALFGGYKSYDSFQAAKSNAQKATDAQDKADAAAIANPSALADYKKAADEYKQAESSSKTAAWTWGTVGLIGAGIAAFSLFSK